MGLLSVNGFIADDVVVNKMLMDGPSIVRGLSPEQVKKIVFSLGADRCEECSTHYIFPTICHNEDVSEASMKLYYYFDKRIFVCFTECDEKFNILGLVTKVHQLRGEDFTYQDARDYVMNYLDVNNVEVFEKSYTSVMERYRKRIQTILLPQYDERLLRMFSPVAYQGWLDEGMTVEAIRRFNILFSASRNAIVIPHYDEHDRLVGIRVRNLDYVKGGDMPKYCPLSMEGNFYTHQLTMNLYGLNVSKNAIRKTKKAIIFESEKSCILSQSYYGENNIAVAVCGSNLVKPQVDMLVKTYGVNDITVAFDKEYEDFDSDKASNYFNKLYRICQSYTDYAQMSFIFDPDNLIGEKDSPIDRGKEVFEKLYNIRVKVRN